MKRLFELVYQLINYKNCSDLKITGEDGLQELLNSMSAYALISEFIIYFKRSMLKLHGKALEFKCSTTSLKEFSNF